MNSTDPSRDFDKRCTSKHVVAIDPSLLAYLPAALVRLGYLYPETAFISCQAGVEFECVDNDVAKMRREVLHAVYRERVFAETLPLRRTLIDGLLA